MTIYDYRKTSLALVLGSSLMMLSCGDIRRSNHDDMASRDTYSIDDFNNVSMLVEELAWHPDYGKRQLLDYFIPIAHAALPPRLQPRHSYRFIFNHRNKTVKIVGKHLVGLERGQIKSFNKTKGLKVYRKFKQILQKKPLLCRVKQRPPGWVGAAQPKYTLYLKNNKRVLFAGAGLRNTEVGRFSLCSYDLGGYIRKQVKDE